MKTIYGCPVADSYKACDCGADCFKLVVEESTDDEPCWGQVSAVDDIDLGDDSVWVHSCKGHEGPYFGGKSYEKEASQ